MHAHDEVTGRAVRHAWTVPGVYIKSVTSKDGAPELLLALIGHYPEVGREQVIEALVDLIGQQASQAGIAIAPCGERLTRLDRYASALMARRWRIEFSTPWIVEKSSRPGMSLASRANAIALSIAHGAKRFATLHLWSRRRAGLAAPDGTEALEASIAVAERAGAQLAKLVSVRPRTSLTERCFRV